MLANMSFIENRTFHIDTTTGTDRQLGDKVYGIGIVSKPDQGMEFNYNPVMQMLIANAEDPKSLYYAFTISTTPPLEVFLRVMEGVRIDLGNNAETPDGKDTTVWIDTKSGSVANFSYNNEPLTDLKDQIERHNPLTVRVDTPSVDFWIDYANGGMGIITPINKPGVIGAAIAELNPHVTTSEIANNITQILTHS